MKLENNIDFLKKKQGKLLLLLIASILWGVKH